jgi:hypothetical protein
METVLIMACFAVGAFTIGFLIGTVVGRAFKSQRATEAHARQVWIIGRKKS